MDVSPNTNEAEGGPQALDAALPLLLGGREPIPSDSTKITPLEAAKIYLFRVLLKVLVDLSPLTS